MRQTVALLGSAPSDGPPAAELRLMVTNDIGSPATPLASHVLTKLGLRDRAAAIVYAFDTGLVAPGG